MGGPKGSKIKIPMPVESLASLQPVLIAGGSKSLFVLTQRGKVLINFHFMLYSFFMHKIIIKINACRCMHAAMEAMAALVSETNVIVIFYCPTPLPIL